VWEMCDLPLSCLVIVTLWCLSVNADALPLSKCHCQLDNIVLLGRKLTLQSGAAEQTDGWLTVERCQTPTSVSFGVNSTWRWHAINEAYQGTLVKPLNDTSQFRFIPLRPRYCFGGVMTIAPVAQTSWRRTELSGSLLGDTPSTRNYASVQHADARSLECAGQVTAFCTRTNPLAHTSALVPMVRTK
jgi:hypothetical protein